MKKLFLTLLTVCALCATSCVDYTAQIDELQKKIDNLNANITRLEGLTVSLGALRDMLVIGQAGDPIVSATATAQGYDFLFKNNGVVHQNNETSGISVGYENEKFYWTLDGQPLTDETGAKAVITVSPAFRINEGHIEVSADGKKTWKQVSDAQTPVITKVEEDASYITVTFMGNTVVEFPKEVKLQVSLSGDGSTMASEGKAVVDFILSGKTDTFTATPLVGEGWWADVVWENNAKGAISFKAPAPVAAASARVFFCDGIGNMVAADIDFSKLTVDESFPVMYPAWEAYGVSEKGGAVDVVLVNNRDEYSVTVEAENNWLTRATSKALREDVITFVAEANSEVQMRSAVVTFTAGTYVKKVVIWQEGVSVISGEDLSANGTANCYIVSKEGDYSFDATVMGCGESGYIAEVAFHVDQWAPLEPVDVTVYLNENDVISDVTLDKTTGRISFHASGAKGNACIQVKNARRQGIWSWHIWCTDVPKERTHTNPDNLQFTLLDRNLGATSADPADGAATHGLYYQWGRKDPYRLTDAVNNMKTNTSHAFAFAIRYPDRFYSMEGNSDGNWYGDANVYLWGSPDYGKNHLVKDLTKTIYDPCPLGYIVPPANAFLIFDDANRTQFTEDGLIVRGDFGQTEFYPYAGRVYGGKSTAGSEVAFWHNNAGRYNMFEYTGANQTLVDKATGTVSFYQGDQRSRGVPVRCVKQVTE